jgi:hypothetical protein
MISEGFSVALVAWCLSALALGLGALLGLRGLLDPGWAQKLVRLKPDEQGGGFAEFRATFGGLFLGVHSVALCFALIWIVFGGALVGVMAAGAAAAIAAAWAGAAFGRTVSMLRDGAYTRFNLYSACVEAALAFVIASPWVLWSVGLSQG